MRRTDWDGIGRWAALAAVVIILACGPNNPYVYQPTAEEIAAQRAAADYEDRVRKYGESVQFEFVEPANAKYRIDGREYPMPARVSLRWRRDHQYPLKLTFGQGQGQRTYSGEIQILRTNAGTKMGLITVDQIKEELITREIERCEGWKVQFEVENEDVAEIRLGNRAEIERDSVVLHFPGVEMEVDKELELAREAEGEWKLWSELNKYSPEKDQEQRELREAETKLKQVMNKEITSVEEAAKALRESRAIYDRRLSEAKQVTVKKRALERARQHAVDARETWDRFWKYTPDGPEKKLPDGAALAESEFQKAENIEADNPDGATGAYQEAGRSYRSAFEESKKVARGKLDDAKAEAAEFKKAWDDWKAARPETKDPGLIGQAVGEMGKAEKYEADKKDKDAINAYGRARDRFTNGLEEAKKRVREEAEMQLALLEATRRAETWNQWRPPDGKRPADTKELEEARQVLEPENVKMKDLLAAGQYGEMTAAYKNASSIFLNALRGAKEKTRTSDYQKAEVSINRNKPLPTPYDYELDYRPDSRYYQGTLTYKSVTYYLSIRILTVTDFTRISKVAIREITPTALREASSGRTITLTTRLDGKPVAETLIGNRPPGD